MTGPRTRGADPVFLLGDFQRHLLTRRGALQFDFYRYTDRPMTMMLLDQETKDALQQLYGETIEAMDLAKKSPDLDDLAATFAVALLKLGMATGFIEQKYPGFAKDVEEKRQRVIAALTQEQAAKH